MNKERMSEINPDALLADGFDDALLGVCYQFGQLPVTSYDYNKCIDILIQRDGMSEEEALEYFEFNVLGSYMGPNTPVFIETF